METTETRGFGAASRYFVDVVAAVPPDRYEQRWSDEWRVLDLIGHGNRANVLAVEYYERPMPLLDPDAMQQYLLPESIAARGREAVLAMGDDPVAAVRAASDRALAVVASAPDDAVAGTPFGARPLAAYLRSRTAELVLHGLDLQAALAPATIAPPPEALLECAAFLIGQAVDKGRGVDVVRALSGRGALDAGFSVY